MLGCKQAVKVLNLQTMIIFYDFEIVEIDERLYFLTEKFNKRLKDNVQYYRIMIPICKFSFHFAFNHSKYPSFQYNFHNLSKTNKYQFFPIVLLFPPFLPSLSTISSAQDGKSVSVSYNINFQMEMEKRPSVLVLSDLQRDQCLSLRYEFLEQLANGNFSRIFKVICKRNESIIALKIESSLKGKNKMTLNHQFALMKKLKNTHSVPKVYEMGEWAGGCFMEMQLLTERLDNRIYSLGEISDLALQMLRVVEAVHAQGVLHQDLQPSSFMRSESGQVKVVGLGQGKFIPIRKHPQNLHPFTGNLRFASLRAHNQFQLTKKDDLESLFYSLAYLYYRKLPWSRIAHNFDHKLSKIKQLKITSRESLFSQMGIPFMRAFEYVVGLQAYGQPDYPHLKVYFKRRKTMALQTKIEIDRSKPKKVSLNFSHFSQIPQQQAKNEHHLEAITSFTFCRIAEVNKEKEKGCSLNCGSSDENVSCDESLEVSMPKMFRNLTFKNPFLL